jgi:VWFA-related protein
MILRNSLLPKPLNQLLPLMLSVALSVAPGFGQSPATGAQQSKDAPQANDSEKGASPRDAQDSVATIAVDVNVVTLPVTVRDKHGEIVKNLSKDDFTLQEDGRAQTIKYFSVEANLPLTLGLLVDTSFSQREALDPERNASRSFLDTMLAQEKDKAFLIHFDREVELLQDLTHSREKLQSALELLKTADPEHGQSNDSDSRSGSEHPHRGAMLYDSIFLASNELMNKRAARKAVIVLSDGVDRGSKSSLESAIEAAQRSETVVYSIYFKGQEEHEKRRDEGMDRGSGRPGSGGGWPGGGGGWPGGGGGYPGGGGGSPGGRRSGGQRQPEEPRVDGKKILERISKETGGRFFEVTKKQLTSDIYASIADELRTQYSLGFTPDKDAAGAGYHHVVLQVKKNDLTVQTREGYYAGGS